MRSFFSLAALALLSGSVLATPTPFDLTPVRRQAPTQTCASGVHVMIAGGCRIPCPTDVAGLLGNVITGITNGIPGSDQYFVPYDSSETQGAESTKLMIEAVNSYTESCPSTPIVFLGYSLGGIIVLNTICGGISPVLSKNVIAAITFGEETYVPGLEYDLGTCTQPAPRFPRNDTQLCTPFANAIQDYCDADDPQCCTGGTNQNVHYAYATKYGAKAVAFVKSQFHPTAPPKFPPKGSTFAAYLAWLAAWNKYWFNKIF